MRTGCEPTRFGNEAKTIIHGDALAELKRSPPKVSIWSLPTHHITSVKILMVWSKPRKKICLSTGCLKWLQSATAFWKSRAACTSWTARKTCPLSISSAASFLPSKVASSGHMTVLEYRRKTLRLHVRTHPDDGERRKELHIQRWCYSGRSQTGSQRALIDYRKNPPQPYNHQKVPGNVWDFPRVRYLMDEYENHPTQKPEALLKRIILASSNPKISFSTRLPVALLPVP